MKDGFDMSKSQTLNGLTGSQVVASRSILGVNIATEPRQRSRSRTLAENETVS